MDPTRLDCDVRLQRINYDLAILLKRPGPNQSTPSIQGIGLFTHVLGAPQTLEVASGRATTDAAFLPLGGPRKLRQWKDSHYTLPTEVHQVWEKLRQAMEDEKQASTGGVLHTQSLKERYGGLDVPENLVRPLPAQLADKTDHNTLSSGIKGLSLQRKRSVASIQQTNGRALDVGGASDHALLAPVDKDDVAMGGTHAEDGFGLSKRRNIYEADRDPRRRR